jgi:ketol-acid reductoisomerase
MTDTSTRIFHLDSANPELLRGNTVAVIGYGNQGRAQALNLRDSGLRVLIGNRHDSYARQAEQDNFPVMSPAEAVAQAQFSLLLLPDEVLPKVFKEQIAPHLQAGSALVFASGYAVAFEQINLPAEVDVLLLAPRMIGVGVRERYLTGQGFYCLVGVHQDASGQAQARLLALTWAISKLQKPAIEVSFKQEAILDLFNEQAFGPAFGRVLLTAITVLVENGLPPEAALVEMYLSEEMAYTYQKMAQTGLVRQTQFHSQTSQYGAMSRGVRFMDLDLRSRMQRIFNEIESGAFAREWQRPLSRLKFAAIRFFAMRQRINHLEQGVRQALGLQVLDEYQPDPQTQVALSDPDLQAELKSFEESFEF